MRAERVWTFCTIGGQAFWNNICVWECVSHISTHVWNTFSIFVNAVVVVVVVVAGVFFLVVILFIRLAWAVLWLWMLSPGHQFGSIQCGFAFHLITEPLVQCYWISTSDRISVLSVLPYIYCVRVRVCALLLRFHSLKYYIFTFRHNINNVQRGKQCEHAFVCAYVRACMPCHRIWESKNPFHLSAVRAVVLITIVITAITIMHTNKKKHKLLWPKTQTLGSVSLTLGEGGRYWVTVPCANPYLAHASIHTNTFWARFHSSSNKMPLWSIFHLIRCSHAMVSVCILLFFMVNEWALTHTSTPHHETAGNDEKSYNSEILWVCQVFHALCRIYLVLFFSVALCKCGAHVCICV